jgi:hypothetical protein
VNTTTFRRPASNDRIVLDLEAVMLPHLRGVLAAGQRAVQCRVIGHTWTDMAYPPACSQCGRTQVAAEADQHQHQPSSIAA